ncbi:MAG: pyruvate, phosphate dikinase/phosphoenolpyruvate synthase regulator, partial [Gammaproteobacteria bacterium]|nr:pyruvate, phosphate dikinase/phosphoenolpyruvate synthase regulator [Gammaproteobacteria bacterium]
MSDKINTARPVFFVSNSTGITVETLGRSLLYQFPDTTFESHSLRFIDTEEKAKEAVATINQLAKHCGLRPIILATLVKSELRDIVAKAEGVYLDVFNCFITPIEEEMGCKALLGMEHSHHGIVDDDYYSERIDAVNYSLRTDDGVRAQEYEYADVILTGASRTGKTPTCLYLAMHYGLRAANYPIVDEEIDSNSLPKILKKHKNKLFGLLVTPERLQSIRNKRRPDSEYASLPQCQYEIRQTQALFQHEDLTYFDVST